MRRTLGVLSTEGAPLGPAPGLDRPDSLAAEANRAGVDVDLTVRVTEALAEGTQLTVYRIVQESLTNAVRHAAPTRCRVTVEADEREIRVHITDEGPPSASAHPARELPGGHGLMGIRERVTMYGGSFEAGPRHDSNLRHPHEEFGPCPLPWPSSAGPAVARERSTSPPDIRGRLHSEGRAGRRRSYPDFRSS
ncbi:sensor histidine kinase [Streptomyces sp. enrichment culture]|uniref:sensor histidine kinase n=1 Tax=Streptomyces sp. enrichment culture TaxID=1795815 RepID=UPI003F5462D9